jgi:anaerobic selenocysteine-containing dehydrogenase
VVVDPRRSRTAENADEHLPIRPGTDALLLFALVHVLFAEGLTRPVEHLEGLEEVERAAQPFTPEAVAPHTGIDAETIRRIAHELSAAETAAVYGRIGTTLNEFGTLASWLVDVVNAITGNLDRPGGAMFALAAAGQSNAREGGRRDFLTGRWASRVRGAPEVLGELPVACLAEEIETPGEGQVRALVTIAGNPCLSTPNSGRLDRAVAQLDFVVSLDVYVNETTRHADVILPGPSPLERPHYDVALYQLAVRNVANYTPPLLEAPAGMPQEWETLLRLSAIAGGQGPEADIEALDDLVARAAAQQSGVADPDALLAEVAPRRGPERLLDILLRTGPYDLTLADLEQAPHGIDLGPLQPRLPGVLKTASGKVELAPAPIMADVPRLQERLAQPPPNGEMVLIGRRQLRSNNSWMHNLEPLVKGKDRCTLHVHPDDARRLSLTDGAPARVASRAGEITAPVEVTDAVRPGVVSLPHGWGHDVPGVRMRVARDHAGVNSNVLADETWIEPLSGNAILNGLPVEIGPVPAGAAQTGSAAPDVPILAKPSDA